MSDSHNLQGGRPVAWITGASRGMGADTAVQLARAGYDIALTARDQARLILVSDEIRAAGACALPLTSNLTDRASVVAFADAALERFGRGDLLCNIGIYKGPGHNQLVMEADPDETALTFEADVIAPLILCQRAIPTMVKAGRGTIINMSSSSVFMEPPGTTKENGWSFTYVAAKAGIDRLASIINVEHAGHGIKAFNVEPGFVAYGANFAAKLREYPGMPVSPPEAIGPAIVWLANNPDAEKLLKKRVYLPGLTAKYRLLPGWDGPGSNFISSRV